MTKKTEKTEKPTPIVERGAGAIRASGPAHHTIWITGRELNELRAANAIVIVVASEVERDDTVELVGQGEDGEGKAAGMVPLASVAVIGVEKHAHGRAILVELMK